MKDLIEVLGCDILGVLVANDAGVVDEDIDVRAKGLERRVDDLLGCVGGFEVALDVDCRAVCLGLDLLHKGVCWSSGTITGIGDGYFGASNGKVESDCMAYATARSGHDRAAVYVSEEFSTGVEELLFIHFAFKRPWLRRCHFAGDTV